MSQNGKDTPSKFRPVLHKPIERDISRNDDADASGALRAPALRYDEGNDPILVALSGEIMNETNQTPASSSFEPSVLIEYGNIEDITKAANPAPTQPAADAAQFYS